MSEVKRWAVRKLYDIDHCREGIGGMVARVVTEADHAVALAERDAEILRLQRVYIEDTAKLERDIFARDAELRALRAEVERLKGVGASIAFERAQTVGNLRGKLKSAIWAARKWREYFLSDALRAAYRNLKAEVEKSVGETVEFNMGYDAAMMGKSEDDEPSGLYHDTWRAGYHHAAFPRIVSQLRSLREEIAFWKRDLIPDQEIHDTLNWLQCEFQKHDDEFDYDRAMTLCGNLQVQIRMQAGQRQLLAKAIQHAIEQAEDDDADGIDVDALRAALEVKP